jgi:hypothetical protein
VRDTPPETNSAVLRVKSGPLARPLLTRVVAMMLTRADCPVDRLDDAMVICDMLAAHACAHTSDGQVEFTVLTRRGALELRIGALDAGGAGRLAAATSVPGLGNVLEPIADDVRIETSVNGRGEQLVLELGFGDGPAGGKPTAGAGGKPTASATIRTARQTSAGASGQASVD